MMTALMYLIVDTCKCRTAYTVLAVIVVDGEVGVTRVVMYYLYAVTGDTVDFVLPVILIRIIKVKLLL